MPGPSPLLVIAAESSGLAQTVHEFRTRLTDRLADTFSPLIPRHRRSALYRAAVKCVDEAMPSGARGITQDAILECEVKLRRVAEYLRDAPPTPPHLAELKLQEERSALAAATSRLKEERRKLKAGKMLPPVSLARMRQELHTAARDATERRERMLAEGGPAGVALPATELLENVVKASRMQASIAGIRAREATSKADADAAWAKHAIMLQTKRRPREGEEESSVSWRMSAPCGCLAHYS